MVTRRLFRSGDSEYLLNGKLCRLRDIQELFMGTGLGPESYALIEQGRIGQILSSRPTDRRAIIEEAAGITKFKTKKRLAEARLEDAKQNLARVNDIFEEVTRQMNSLKRQASKAERYAKLREEMRAKLRLVLASKFAQFDQESAALDTQIINISDEMKQQADCIQQLEAEHGDRTQRGYAIETELRENRERLNQIKLESDRAHAQRRHNEERCAELMVRSASSEAELEQARNRLTALEKERDSNRQMLDSAAADVAAAQQESTVPAGGYWPQPMRVADLEQQARGIARRHYGSSRDGCSICAISSLRRKNAWRPSIVKPSVCKRRCPTRTLKWKLSAASAGSSLWNLNRFRSALRD